MEQHFRPPAIASKLLSVMVPLALREPLIGDLNEEFMGRVKRNERQARSWFWKQTMFTSAHFLGEYLASENLLRKLVFLVTIVLFPTLLLGVYWLSNVDSSSEYIWNNLLAGKMHSIVLTSEFWTVGSQALLNHVSFKDIGIYLHVPSGIWAITVFAVLYFRNKHSVFSAHQAAAWGTTLMLMPYFFGLIYIQLNNLEPKQIGPIIAIMTISIIYTILPLAWLVINKTKHPSSA